MESHSYPHSSRMTTTTFTEAGREGESPLPSFTKRRNNHIHSLRRERVRKRERHHYVN
jgi:hypothetical protein